MTWGPEGAAVGPQDSDTQKFLSPGSGALSAEGCMARGEGSGYKTWGPEVPQSVAAREPGVSSAREGRGEGAEGSAGPHCWP